MPKKSELALTADITFTENEIIVIYRYLRFTVDNMKAPGALGMTEYMFEQLCSVMEKTFEADRFFKDHREILPE